jgi:serine phosphatase RsbU (regulator of sigma subunit)
MSTYSQSWPFRARAFPRFTPHVPNLDYYGECRPAGERGGDFFDFVPLDDGALALCLGEAEGSSRAASVTATGMQSFLRSLSLQRHGAPIAVVEEVNLIVHEIAPSNFAATLFYARVDPVNRQLLYLNGCHESALLVRKRPFRVFHLQSTGPVVGVSRRVYWEQRRMPLEPGDVLVAFTGGVGRAMCEDDVVSVVQENADARAGTLVAGILEAAGRGSGDRTVLAVRFTGAEEPALAEEESELSLAVA